MIGVNSPLRLLREKWSDPASLAQELYAMFTAKGPVEINDTLTIRVPGDKPALKIERQDPAPDSFDFGQRNTLTKQQIAAAAGRDNAPTPAGRRSRPEDARRAVAGPAEDRRREAGSGGTAYDPATTARRPTSPLIEVSGGVRFSGNDPVTFSTPPLVEDPRTGRTTTISELARSEARDAVATSATSTFLGKVSGTVDAQVGTFTAVLYPNGPNGNPGTTITFTVPQIAPGEVIPADTWVAPILKINGKYYCQVPVWLE